MQEPRPNAVESPLESREDAASFHEFLANSALTGVVLDSAEPTRAMGHRPYREPQTGSVAASADVTGHQSASLCR